jgi:hypothetical protein
MKKSTAILALALFTMPLTLAAQNGMSGQGMGQQDSKAEVMQKLEKMSAALQLTPQQKQQMLPILMEEAPKMKALKENTSLGPMQKAMQLHQIANATDAKVKPILNPQQYQTWEQMREQERQQAIQKMENR